MVYPHLFTSLHNSQQIRTFQRKIVILESRKYIGSVWGYLDISGCLSIFHIKYITSVPTMTMSRSYTFNKMLSLRRYTAQGVRFYHPCAKTLTPGSLIAHPCAEKSAQGLSTVHPCTKKSAQGSDCWICWIYIKVHWSGILAPRNRSKDDLYAVYGARMVWRKVFLAQGSDRWI